MSSLIRCEAMRYSVVIDAEREIYGTSNPELVYWRFPVLKWTPKGAWIYLGFTSGGPPPTMEEVDREWRRFVLLTAVKQYASRTEAEARSQFAYRKKRQIKILSRKLREAEDELRLASGGSL